MYISRRLVKSLVVIAVVATYPAHAVVAQESWVGKSVLHNKPTSQVKFGDRIGDKEVTYQFSGIWPFVVRDERDGWLRIHDRRNEGWVDKNDFVLQSEAVEYFTRKLQDNPKDTFSLNMRAGGWHDRKEYDKAIADYDAAIAIQPNDPTAYNNRGVAWRDKKDYDKAIADYSEAIRINSKVPVYHVNRGVAYRLKNEFDKAIDDYTECIRLEPRYAMAFYNRGICFYLKKDYDTALRDYDDSIRLDPKYAPAYLERGLTWRMKNNYDKAIANYDEALRLDPKSAPAYYHRGISKLLKKEYAASIKDYDEAIRLNPKYAFAFRERGIAHKYLKDYGKALADYEAAIRIDANYSTVMADQAWLLATCPEAKYRDGQKAVTVAKKACELTKDKVASQLSALAAAHAEAGDFKEAVRWQKKVMEFDDYMRQFGNVARQRLKLYEAGQPYREGMPLPAPPKDI